MIAKSIFEKNKITTFVYLAMIMVYVCYSVCLNSLLIGIDIFISQTRLLNIEKYLFSVALIALYFFNQNNVQSIDRKIIIKKAFVLAIFILLAYKAGGPYLVTLTCFVFAAECVDSTRKIAGAMAIGLLTATVIVFASSQLGIIEDFTFNRLGRTGHGFGFWYYSFLPTNLLFVWIMGVYAIGKKLSWSSLILSFAAASLIYYYSTQRLSYYLTIIVLVMYVVIIKLDFIKIHSKFIKLLSLIGFSSAAIISIVLSKIYTAENVLLKIIDKLLVGRLALGKIAFERYDVTFFSQNVEFTYGDNYFFIDCGYIYVLLLNGLVIFIIAVAMYTLMHYISCKLNDKMLFIWITAQMIYTVVNNVWIDLDAGTCIPLFVVLIKMLMKSKSQNECLSDNNLA